MVININSVTKYKGRTIVKFDNDICYFIFIVGMDKSFGSITDAKKYINGQPTTWSVQEMYAEFKEMAKVAETMI